MTVEIHPFRVADLDQLDIQDKHSNHVLFARARPMTARQVLESPFGWTAWAATGQPVASCGIDDKGHAWALLSKNMKPYMLAVSRGVRFMLELHADTRGPVYTGIDPKYPEAARWAKILGFRPTGDDDNMWVYE